ncbi:MAG: flagellar biosynthesis protein FlhA [Oligoflexia bacterium]|nr:flagellar biosynthesis protein FlhA [Oligoflexia bacterium]
MDTTSARHLTIPIALIGTLCVLLIPLPTWLLDVFLALNITISMVILFVSLYMERALMFTSFPALLLLTTLFRLAMNIAATRLILLQGHQGTDAAGHVIKAFGEFVIGGSFVIGVVVYIAISIINLKVITKGTSRIAEVAARFTLDAMPGKQVAIDSDLNIGLINEDEAKRRRKELAMESEFYGAMDGAAKFVSGDAMAAMMITFINIGGGLFVGILQKGMDWMVAAQTYTLLTIGDGLVAQIPSVIISTAAGLIVARAASGEDLNAEVIGQLSKSSKPLYLASAVCVGLSLVPGLPFLPFIGFSALVGSLGLLREKVAKKAEVAKEQEAKTATEKPAVAPGSTEEVTGLLGMDTLELEVGYELVSLVEGGDLVERIRSLRRQFALDYGFIVPAIHIRDNVRIKPSEYRFMLRGSQIGGGELKTRYLLAMDPGNANGGVEGIPTKEPAFGLDALWIPEGDKEKAQFSGYTVVDLSTVVTTHLTEMLRANMDELIGRQEVQHLIDNIAKDAPKVIEELIPNLLTLGQVQQVLSLLLREQISVRDLRTILETLADWAPHFKVPEKLAEQVRKRMGRTITAKYVTADGVLPLCSLQPALERGLFEAVQHTDEGSFLALEPAYAQQLITKTAKMAEKFVEMGQTPVVLAPAGIRPALFNFLRRFVPGVAVISHQEIAPNTKVQSLGVLNVE